MKKILLSVAMLSMALCGRAETQDVCGGWPADYDGVMLQGFWWDSYNETTWAKLTEAAPELSQYFDLIWVPNSGTVTSDPDATTQGPSMGYDPCFWLSHNSCFGTESELRTMIQTYKSKGVGIIEDVVINHKKGQSSWLDFPNEEVTVGNKTYTIDWNGTPAKYITKNDDCNYQGYTTSGNYDTGDDFPGFRDLDHTSEVTRGNIKVYLDYLLNELGYAGFRYDLVKGYGAGFIQEYNNSAMPTYSVGEYWDNQTNIQNWIMGTGNTSAAFDFPLKYKINDAISGGDYSALDWKSFTYDPNFSQYSVTFADNHDSGREEHSKLKYNWSAANAFILASPGTPCIWYPHYKADKENIQKMIRARKDCGISNTNCRVNSYSTDNNRGYVMESFGSKGSLFVLLGEATNSKVGEVPSNYQLVAEGDAYKFYSSVFNYAYVIVSPNGGQFTSETLDITLTGMNYNEAYYKIGESGDLISLSGTYTETIGAGVAANTEIPVIWKAKSREGNEYTGTVTFTKRDPYPTPSFESDEPVGVFFETDENLVTIWAWDKNNDNYTGGNWETKPAMELKGLNNLGKLVYKWTYKGEGEGMPDYVIFAFANGQTETFDFVNHGYYTSDGLSYRLANNTVYFDNTASNWTNVYYYAWDSQGHCKTEWPGEEIKGTNGDGLYEVTLDGVYSSIIFNDPGATGVKQTKDLTVVDKTVYKLEASTVTFDNTTTKWENVYFYAYTKDEVPMAKWPGEKIASPNAEGKYSVTLLDDYTKVIFNDGVGGVVGVNQTENLDVTDGGEYAIGTHTVYFDNSPTNWTNVFCYAYANDQVHNANWPGVEIAKNADDLYEATLLEGYTYVIFNNGKENGSVVGVDQTADLPVVDGKTYSLYADISSVALMGEFNDWNKPYIMTVGDNNTWTYLLDLTDVFDDVAFKLYVNESNWLGNRAVSVSAPNDWVVDATEGDDPNIKLMNTNTGYKTYRFTATWTPGVSAAAGWALTIEGVDLRPLYTVAGSESILGAPWTTTDSNNDMIKAADNTYYLIKTSYLMKEPSSNDVYEFKIVVKHSWNENYPSENKKIICPEDGLYEIKFTFNPTTKEVDYQLTPKSEIVIVDGEPCDVTNDFTVAKASYSRPFKNNWGTLCLPFEIKNSYDGVTFYRLSEVDEETNVMTFEALDAVSEGQPVVYKAEDGVDLNIVETDVKVTSYTGIDRISNTWHMYGTFTNLKNYNSSDGNIYYIANNQFWLGINNNIAPYRAYFWNQSSASGAPFRIEVGNEEDIQLVEQEDGSVKVYYDLQGRRLNHARKGLVIENGKLIFIK